MRSKTVLICAHYDHLGVEHGHMYPGADDNASGIAALLEIAHAFAANPHRPKRSILFIAFGCEEPFMVGSRSYVARHEAR